MNSETDDLNARELSAFASLTKAKMPPSLLEERIVARLKTEDLIRQSTSGWSFNLPKLAITATAALVLVAAGIAIGSRWRVVPSGNVIKPQYMLVLKTARPALQAQSADDVRQRVKEYSAWARDLEAKGMLLGGEKLKREGRLLSEVGGQTKLVDTRSDSAEGAIAGYFLISTTDYDQAMNIAMTCPHLRHGGTVELRQIERF
jgi:hypothetical protein